MPLLHKISVYVVRILQFKFTKVWGPPNYGME